MPNIIYPPNIPNCMNFWHGGNLNDYDENISHKNGRYEYGAGLYIITNYSIAQKYSKGSRKLYLLSVEVGNEISKSKLNINDVKDLIHSYIMKNKINIVLNRVEKYVDKDNMIPAHIFNNIIINNDAIKPTNTKYLRQFLIDNNIDYELVQNPFGFGETMMVLYNMKKIKNIIQIKPTDRIEVFDLPSIN